MNATGNDDSSVVGSAPYREIVTESAVYGVILVSGMIVVIGSNFASIWTVLFQVLGTVVIFWAAHVYAGTVARLGQGDSIRADLGHAFRDSLHHSNGMLFAPLIPLSVLALGGINVIDDDTAIWGALWIDIVVLGALGYIGIARLNSSMRMRIVGALGTAALGMLLVGLKAFIH